MFTMDASLCGTTLLPKHAVNLFGHAAVKTQLSSRPEDLLGVRVAVNDGLPQHICERCKRRVETLERAVADLERFSSQVRESYEILLLTRAPLKRTKESSASIGVSPDTIRARPQATHLINYETQGAIQQQLDYLLCRASCRT